MYDSVDFCVDGFERQMGTSDCSVYRTHRTHRPEHLNTTACDQSNEREANRCSETSVRCGIDALDELAEVQVGGRSSLGSVELV